MIASGQPRLATTCIALLVAGCAAPITMNPVGGEAPQVASAPALPPTTTTPIEPAPKVSAPEAPAPSAQTLPPPPPPRDETELRAAYGTPSFVRREAESELWRYDGGGCTLFVFLYRANEAVLIRHMETLPRNPDMTADETCLTSIRARKTG